MEFMCAYINGVMAVKMSKMGTTEPKDWWWGKNSIIFEWTDGDDKIHCIDVLSEINFGCAQRIHVLLGPSHMQNSQNQCGGIL